MQTSQALTPDRFGEQDLEQLSKILKILSEPNRLALFNQIMSGVQCNCELGDSLSMAPNLVSHHLSVLCESGLVTSKRDEDDHRWIYYSIERKALNAFRERMGSFFDEDRIQPCTSVCGPKSKR